MAFVDYCERGTRLAVINSQPGVAAPTGNLSMPEWNWISLAGPAGLNSASIAAGERGHAGA